MLQDTYRIVQPISHAVHHRIFIVIYHFMVLRIFLVYVYAIVHGHIGMVSLVPVNYLLVVNVQATQIAFPPLVYSAVITLNLLVNVIVIEIIFGMVPVCENNTTILHVHRHMSVMIIAVCNVKV